MRSTANAIRIVDPRTGLGLVGRMSVTVVAPAAFSQIADEDRRRARTGAGSRLSMAWKVLPLLIRKTERDEEVYPSKRFDSVPQKKGRPGDWAGKGETASLSCLAKGFKSCVPRLGLGTSENEWEGMMEQR